VEYYRIPTDGDTSLVAVDGDQAVDVSGASDRIDSLRSLASIATAADETIDDTTRRFWSQAPAVEPAAVERAACPIVPDEVWATGGTFRLRDGARDALSPQYREIYDADRPQFFFKATAANTVGPGDRIGIRADSAESIPEAELAAVLHDGAIVGYTIANDVSSRSIEMNNPHTAGAV
jgi:2-dehydro-3-deoxy-D-arabinonate dehydratase